MSIQRTERALLRLTKELQSRDTSIGLRRRLMDGM
jgi:hypothetical protein